ncbi:MAG: 6-bladed beta-propeller [Gemmatimonadales bacterium]
MIAITQLLIMSACGGKDTVIWHGTVDTLENGTVRVSNPAEGTWHEGSTWRLVEEVKIGTREGKGPQVFGDIADIDVDRIGRVYVLDRQAQEVRVFGSDGRYVRTIGRLGRGPGELSAATGMAFDPLGRLWVLNQGNLRYSVFDTSGIVLQEPSRLTGARVAGWYGVFSSEGDLYDRIFYVGPTGVKTGYVRYDTTTGQFVDTMSASRFPEGTPLGWGRSLLTPKGRWLGVASDYRLYNTTFDGRDTLRIVERSYERTPFSSAERDSAERQLRDMRKRMMRGSPRISIPEYEKIFQGFVIDDEDYLWVILSRAPEADSTTFDVFDPVGRYLGAVVAPYPVEPRPPPIIRGGKMAFVTKDELDVPYVVTVGIQGRD